MTDIEQQARKEAEEYCERVHPYAVSFGLKETIITCHAEALISERSKPIATCEPIYGDYGGINGYSCSNCSAPIGPPEFSRYCGNCARKVLWPEGADYQTHPPEPSLMVGFSEEEIERIALGRLPVELFQLNEDGKLDMPSVPPIDINSDLRAQFIDGLRYANANTRAVSIDRIMEVVKPYASHKPSCLVATTMLTSNPPQPGPDVPGTCTCGLADLRERLIKIDKQ